MLLIKSVREYNYIGKFLGSSGTFAVACTKRLAAGTISVGSTL